MTPPPHEADPGATYRRTTVDDRNEIFRVLETANFHNIPSPEMPSIALEDFFAAEVDGTIVGVAGFTVLADGRGKTTLMAVDPDYRRFGIGRRLQELRMQELIDRGCSEVITNADLPEVISWYQKNFGYEPIGTLEKRHEFGSSEIHEWTTLRSNLLKWTATRSEHSTD